MPRVLAVSCVAVPAEPLPVCLCFAKTQAALFALAVADVLLVNIWCHDIGREQGSGKPLMKTIFQVGSLAQRQPQP